VQVAGTAGPSLVLPTSAGGCITESLYNGWHKHTTATAAAAHLWMVLCSARMRDSGTEGTYSTSPSSDEVGRTCSGGWVVVCGDGVVVTLQMRSSVMAVVAHGSSSPWQ
jgi:hypothetical protein